jgi:23S rRNA (adenine-N6)-dimethyltransferase
MPGGRYAMPGSATNNGAKQCPPTATAVTSTARNYLTDRQTIRRIIDLVRDTCGPILEIGPGEGALTRPLLSLGRPVHAVEIDPRLARKLNQELGLATITEGDFLKHRIP